MPRPRQHERSLVSYLIFPRPEDWIKWLIAPGVFLATAWSQDNFSQWPRFLALWLILEYLIYEARYQWNDIRGITDDRSHAERRARGRLPAGPDGQIKRSVLISIWIALARLGLAVFLGWWLNLEGPVLLLLAVVFLVAIFYERLRSVRARSVPARPTLTAMAIWLVVGLGYGVRAGLGFIVGGYQARSWQALAGIACFVTFGIMFVLLTWVLEAMSFCRTDTWGRWRADPRSNAKTHVMLLLNYVPVKLYRAGYLPNSKGPFKPRQGTPEPVLMAHGKILTPWNYALTASAGFGGALGAALAHAKPTHISVTVLVFASLAFALFLVRCDFQVTRMLTVAIGYVTITGAAAAFSALPYLVLAGAPWLTISLLYSFFRGSSYRDLNDFGYQLKILIIKSLRVFPVTGILLLRVVVGDATWRNSRFDSSRRGPDNSGRS